MAKVLDEFPEDLANPRLTELPESDTEIVVLPGENLIPTISVDEDREYLKPLDTQALLAAPPPKPPWLVAPLLATGSVTLLAGREGEGKSMLALGLARAVARGSNIAELDTRGNGKVLYVDAENGEFEIARRLHLLGVSSDVDFLEADGFSLNKHIHHLKDALGRRVEFGSPVKLLILDSLASLNAGGSDGWENDPLAVERLFYTLRKLARDFKCAILALHHLNKYGETYRGTTALGAGAQIVTFLVKNKDKSTKDKAALQLRWHKCRMAAKPSAMDMEFIEQGMRLNIVSPLPQVNEYPD